MTTVLFGYARPAITASPSGVMRTMSNVGFSGNCLFAVGSEGFCLATANDFGDGAADPFLVGLEVGVSDLTASGGVLSSFHR